MRARRSLSALLVGAVIVSGCSSEEPENNGTTSNTGAPIGGSTGLGTTTGGSGSSGSTGVTGTTSNGGTTNGSGPSTTGGTTNGSTGNGGTSNGSTTNGGTGSGSNGTSTGGSSTGTSGGGTTNGGTSTGTSTTGGDGDAGPELAKFSFFVTSLAAMRKHSGSQDGFGGDLRFGETGDGAGLRGADKLCTKIAEESMPGSGAKEWHAFLSTSTANAKDRIGTGPWYDRMGRLIANDLTGLLKTRPTGADTMIINDLPNETGAPNRAGSAEGANDDNHDTVTATKQDGTFDGGGTCSDFTATTGTGPRLGHSWPANSGMSWTTAHYAPGCKPSVALEQTGPGSGDGIGNGGGYGGIYCFAKKP